MRKKHKARGRAERAALEQVAARAGVEIVDGPGEQTVDDGPASASAGEDDGEATEGAAQEGETAGEEAQAQGEEAQAQGEAPQAQGEHAPTDGQGVEAHDDETGTGADDGAAEDGAADGDAADGGAAEDGAAEAEPADADGQGEDEGVVAGGDVASRTGGADRGPIDGDDDRARDDGDFDDGLDEDGLDEEDEEDEDEATAAARPQAGSLDDTQFKALIEALVFASDKPLTIARLRQLTRVSDTRRIQVALDALTAEHADTGIVLSAVSGGYSFRTHASYSPWVQQLIAGRPVRLSRAQLETLAIIAYRQPITRPEIDQIRGVDSGATLKLLLDRSLIRILGKREEVGRPLLYGTTKEFLDFFSLSELRELPTLREYSELTPESRSVIAAKLGADPLASPPSTPLMAEDEFAGEGLAAEEAGELPSEPAEPVTDAVPDVESLPETDEVAEATTGDNNRAADERDTHEVATAAAESAAEAALADEDAT